MTGLHNTVRRLTKAEYRGRKLVIELRPGLTPTVFVREAGRRVGYSLPIDFIYKVAASKEAESKRKEKRKHGK